MKKGSRALTETPAAARFGSNYDLLHYFAQHILNVKLLASLVLVCKGYHAIFTPRLWRNIADNDLNLVQGLDPTEHKLRYIKRFTTLRPEDEISGHGGGFPKLLSQMSNLESFTDFHTTHTTLDLIRQNCPKIRELHLRFRSQERITPSTLHGFTNLTSLILDNLDGLDSWNQWTTFFIDLLDASPGLEELGLFNLQAVYIPNTDRWKCPHHFRVLCEELAKRSPSQRLHLRSLLLGSDVFAAGFLGQDCIQHLTDLSYLEHLHIGGTGTHYLHAIQICHPEFVSPEITPNLRLITTLYNNKLVNEWLQDLHSRYPSFAQKLTHRVSEDWRYHTGPNKFGPIYIRHAFYYELQNLAPPGTFHRLRNDARLLQPLALPGHSRTFPYGLTTIQSTHQDAAEAPGPTGKAPTLPFRSLTLNLYWPRPGLHPIDEEVLFNIRSHLLHISSAGALKSLTIYPNDDSGSRDREHPNPASKKRMRMGLGLMTATMVNMLNGLNTLEDLHFPLLRSKSAREREAENQWERKVILMLADDGVLPRLRHVKIFGPCFEVVRGTDNRVVRLIELDKNEEQSLVWFRDIWEF
ncbi:hypothetical protein QBC37DRAFT_431688 [Rhypophila decipiens]|uniref:Uncharacterized protein n=1 Tax=Rhypophila decipiens TaxID=261697 RepID=A0AAN6XZP9_9PEZI|nr:hypothetical protein QBC37DRAFT_431688 [Rhypophila decipiens]